MCTFASKPFGAFARNIKDRMQCCKMFVKWGIVFHHKGLFELPLRFIAPDPISAAHTHRFKKPVNALICLHVSESKHKHV